jgi:hypothetical protein
MTTPEEPSPFEPPKPPANQRAPEALLAFRARQKRLYWYIGAGMTVVLALGIYFYLSREDPFVQYMKKAKRSEVDVNLNRLRRATQVMYIEELRLPDATPVTPSGTSPCCSSGGPSMGKCAPDSTLWTTGAWEQLGFSVDDPHFFRYEIERPDADTVVFRAYGDLDCDQSDVVHELTGRAVSGDLQFDEVRVIGTD